MLTPSISTISSAVREFLKKSNLNKNVDQLFVQQTNQETLNSLFCNAFPGTVGAGVFKPVTQVSFDATIEKICKVLPDELRKVQLNRARIFQLYSQAARGQLAAEMLKEGGGAESNRSLKQPTGIVYAQVEAASRWVFDSSTTNQGLEGANAFAKNTKKEKIAEQKRVDAKHKALTDAMWQVVSHNKDVTSLNTLDYLHQNCGSVATTTRAATGASLYQFYGGTAIGRYLHGEVSRLASHLGYNVKTLPQPWYDVAAFMMVGYIICHGYADGNGRAARAIYGCTLVQKKLPFVAPSDDWQTANIASQYRLDFGHPNAP